MSSVVVSHPHAAPFAVGLATSLAQSGQLSRFITGVAFKARGLSGAIGDAAAAWWPVLNNRILPDLPPERVQALPWLELGARVAAATARRVGFPLKAYDAVFPAHDAAVSRLSWPEDTSALYAYEDGALWTFRRAARLDLARVWDLPLPHYRTIEDLWPTEAGRWPSAVADAPAREPAWKQRRKDAELALATTISVASTFTKQSLQRLNVRVPILVTPYGFPVHEFPARERPPTGRFTVLAVGSHDLRKGTPYLLEAWKRAAIPDAELHLVGAMRLAKSFVDGYAGLFRHWPHVPRSELPARYAAADLLAFPTLGDGFGLVIQEAMCTGTPVVTTPCGGGPESITDDVDGWLVPPRDIDALVERFRACAADRDRTYTVGLAARARAERWTWRDAGASLARALDEV